jgi:hypothetical protein
MNQPIRTQARTLIGPEPSSQEHQVPIFELTAAQLEQKGRVLITTQKSQEDFRKLFSAAADRVIAAIDADRN